MMERLNTWPARFAHVGDVRGLGLMLGIEMVRDQATRERAPELRNHLVQLAFEKGLLVLGAGENTIRLSPPLIITHEQAAWALDVLEQCLTSIGDAV
jgi:4-aminobutyrate aminotransferase